MRDLRQFMNESAGLQNLIAEDEDFLAKMDPEDVYDELVKITQSLPWSKKLAQGKGGKKFSIEFGPGGYLDVNGGDNGTILVFKDMNTAEMFARSYPYYIKAAKSVIKSKKLDRR